MGITNAARDLALAALAGEAVVPFNNATARIAVGDSSIPFAAAQVALQAVTNTVRQGMEVSYPVRTGNILTFRSIFGTAAANFTWNEWGVFNDGTAGSMLNRKVEALGTKTSAQSWQLTVILTLDVA